MGVYRKAPMIIQLLILLAVFCAVVAAAAYLFQRRMMYFPDRARPSEEQCCAAGLLFWPQAGDGYRGFIGRAKPAGAEGLIVVFHGNAGAAWNRDYYVHALGPLGYRVVVAEYPGYGGRGGRWGERQLVQDAKETVRIAHGEFGGPVFLWGESLGCGVAAAVAADPPVPVEGVVMITPWDSLPELAQTHYRHLPVRRFMRDRYDNIRNLRSYRNPVAVVAAERDEIVPATHAMRLYDALAGPKRLWVFKGVGHNTWPTGPNEGWWREVAAFTSGRET